MGYTADITSGETFSASRYYSSDTPYQAFDDNIDTDWNILSPVDGSDWIQVQFASAKQIEKFTIRSSSWSILTAAPIRLVLKGSNTGSFSGEETEVKDTDVFSWSDYGEVKSFEFSNANTFTYYRVFVYRNSESFLSLAEIEMMEFEAVEVQGGIEDGASIDDLVNAFNLTDEISEAAGIGDLVDAYGPEVLTAAVAFGDLIDAMSEADGSLMDAIGMGDACDAFNWTAWFASNRDRAVIRYYCTLTGANDSLADLSIPISSFQARKRSGESTYLSVVVPGMALADSIADRLNGELVINMAYLISGVESLREEIIRVDLEQINPSIGPRNRSITLIGHKTVTYDARAASIQGSNYKYENDGLLGFRFPQADPYLNPGDALTVIDTNDVFTVDYITYAISARGAKFMEVREG